MSTSFFGDYNESTFIRDITETATIPVTAEYLTADHVEKLANEVSGIAYSLGLPGLRGGNVAVWGTHVALTGTAISSLTTLVFSASQTAITVGVLVAGASPTSTGWRKVTAWSNGLTATVNAAFDVNLAAEQAYVHGTLAKRLVDYGLADMAESRIKGRAAGAGSGPMTDLTPVQVGAVIGTGGYARLSTIGTTTDGWGSTKTKIVRFTTTAGSGATITQSAVNGDSITITVAGWYIVSGALYTASGLSYNAAVITVNTSDAGTTDTVSQINGTKARFGLTAGADGSGATMSRMILLAVSDVVRLHGRGSDQIYHADAFLEVVLVVPT